MNAPPLIMGVVNVTPDSFSDGGRYASIEAAVDAAMRMVDEGAGALDVGGESTRPGAGSVPVEVELERVMPVLEAIRARTDRLVSIDTRKPDVARVAVELGADIWNDVSALTYSESSLATAAELGCRIVLMHAQGDPSTMQDAPSYGDVVEEVAGFLKDRLSACVAAGVAPSQVMIDPGIGFGKSLEHNLALFRALDRFARIAPTLLGASRKRFIAALDRNVPPAERLGGSVAAAIAGAVAGGSRVRVHDVAATRQALAVWSAIRPR